MEDFNSYAKDKENNKVPTDLMNLVKNIASKYNGKNANELLSAIYAEAEKGKKQGTLTNEDIDKFAKTLSPFLDDKKRKMLNKLVEELKKI